MCREGVRNTRGMGGKGLILLGDGCGVKGLLAVRGLGYNGLGFGRVGFNPPLEGATFRCC